MRILFFDTETTGLWNFKAEASHPSQPSIVQLAALLYENGEEVSKLNSLISDGYDEISPRAQEVHGISKEKAQAEGITLASALATFTALVNQASILVCHNFNFDSRLIEKSAALCKVPNPLEGKNFICTMEESTDYCAIVSPWKRNSFKWPKLTELYFKLFEKDFENAHDALGDVIATKDCFFELEKRKLLRVVA